MKSAAASPSLPVTRVAPIQRSAFEQDVAAAGPSSTSTADDLFLHLSSELLIWSPDTDDWSLEDISDLDALLENNNNDELHQVSILKDLGKILI